MKLKNRFGGIPQFVELITLVIIIELVVNCVCLRQHRKRHSHNRHYHNSIDTDSNLNDKKIILGGKSGRTVEWSGQGNTTCSKFSSFDEFYYDSKCSSVITSTTNQNITENQFQQSLQSHGGASEFWGSCQDNSGSSCSIIYIVENGTKIKQVFIDGIVDSKAQVVILAEYFSDRGNVYQIGRLRGYDGNHGPHNVSSSSSMSKVAYTYVHEDYLDLAVLNVTIKLNGGFSIINNFTIILEEQKETQHTEPIIDKIVLDKKEDEEEKEWYEVTCHYSDYFEDFWTFGCPVQGDFNDLPTGSGFWFPCHAESCSFVYDGSYQGIGKPTSVEVKGYFQGGSISLTSNSHVSNVVGWRLLETKVLHNSTVSLITFDLNEVCNVNALQILASPGKSSIILVEKITVHVDPRLNSSSCSFKPRNVTATESTKDLEVSYRTSGSAQSIPRNVDSAIFLLLLCSAFCLKK